MSFRPKWRNLLLPELSSCAELKSRFLDSAGAPLEMTTPRELNSYAGLTDLDDGGAAPYHVHVGKIADA